MIGDDLIGEVVQDVTAPAEVETQVESNEDTEETWEEVTRASFNALKAREEAKEAEGPQPISEEGVGRDEKGRFLPKKAKIDSTEGRTKTSSSIRPEAQESAESRSEDSVPAPQFWKDENRKLFETAPAELKRAIHEEVAKGTRYVETEAQKFIQARQRVQRFESAIAPRAQVLQEAGIDPADVINNFFDWDAELRKSGPAALARLAARYRINVQDVVEHSTRVNPEAEIWRERATGYERRIQSEQEAARSRVLQQIEFEIDSFKSATDASGKALHPHVAEVEHIMEPIVQRLRAQAPQRSHREILADAYAQAVWAHPQLRDSMEAERRAQDEAKRIAAAKEKAEKAKRALVPIRGGYTGPTGIEPASDWVTAARNAYRQSENGRI